MTLLAIDGPAGAGKTTLAAKLEAEYAIHSRVKTIHMDDLYDGWSNALNQRLTETLSRIALAHNQQKAITVQLFNWHLMKFDREEIIEPIDYLILEGVGAAQAVIRNAGAITYWLEIDDETGLQRVLNRDGKHLEQQMRMWQMQQSLHFATDRTRENCELKITS